MLPPWTSSWGPPKGRPKMTRIQFILFTSTRLNKLELFFFCSLDPLFTNSNCAHLVVQGPDVLERSDDVVNQFTAAFPHFLKLMKLVCQISDSSNPLRSVFAEIKPTFKFWAKLWNLESSETNKSKELIKFLESRFTLRVFWGLLWRIENDALRDQDSSTEMIC